jgi:TRAP transporter TAXI family solute receptor
MGNFRILLLVCSIFLVCHSSFAEQRTIKIGSGSILKGYYSIGLDICKTMMSADQNVNCEVVPTSGGVENLALLEQGKIDFALVQSDLALEAYEGTGYYSATNRMQNIRQVLNLYEEVFTVITKAEDKISSFADIGGKEVSSGPTRSSPSITYNILKSLYHFAKDPINANVYYEDLVQKLCSGEIDVAIITAGHPNALVGFIANTCQIAFVPIEQEKVKQLVKVNKAFHPAVLSKDLYPGPKQDTNTVGVTAILVTDKNMDSKFLDNFIGTFHRTVKYFTHANYLLRTVDINSFADTNNFVLPKHQAVRNRN